MKIFNATDGKDVITGTSLADWIQGLLGDDIIFGRGGDDTLDGGEGNDLLFGGLGNDELFGGIGNDNLFGGADDDKLDGGEGDDALFGGAGKDVLLGGAGADYLDGGKGDDLIVGGSGVDTIFTGRGYDTVKYDVLESNGIAGDGIRQVTSAGVTDNLEDWSIKKDTFAFDADAFDFAPNKKVSFFNGTADKIKDGANVIVLQDTDNDNNPATAFNAGAAATLIANNVDVDGAGFFVYWNSDLQINRLVYSANLNDATADITVLANINTLEGQDAIDALATFSASNFDFV